MAFLVVPASLTTQLQAVNTLIMSLGEAQVDSISPPPHSDAEDALAYLNMVDLEVQASGWFWNAEENFPLTRDPLTGFINLPDQTLWCGPNAVESTYNNIVQRGAQMYDREGHTRVFKSDIKADIIIRLDWDSLPQVARSYITLEACQRFQATKQASQIVLQVNGSDKNRAWVQLQQQEDADRQNNTTYATAVLLALQGTGGMVRNRFGIRSGSL